MFNYNMVVLYFCCETGIGKNLIANSSNKQTICFLYVDENWHFQVDLIVPLLFLGIYHHTFSNNFLVKFSRHISFWRATRGLCRVSSFWAFWSRRTTMHLALCGSNFSVRLSTRHDRQLNRFAAHLPSYRGMRTD